MGMLERLDVNNSGVLEVRRGVSPRVDNPHAHFYATNGKVTSCDMHVGSNIPVPRSAGPAGCVGGVMTAP